MDEGKSTRRRLLRARDLPGDQRVRAHVLTTAILIGTIVVLVLVVSRPIVLLWLLLAVVAVMAYAGIYLVVSARMVDDEPTETRRRGRPERREDP